MASPRPTVTAPTTLGLTRGEVLGGGEEGEGGGEEGRDLIQWVEEVAMVADEVLNFFINTSHDMTFHWHHISVSMSNAQEVTEVVATSTQWTTT